MLFFFQMTIQISFSAHVTWKAFINDFYDYFKLASNEFFKQLQKKISLFLS